MEPILIIIIILIASTIGKAIRKGRRSKSRREVPDSPEKTPDRSSPVKKKEEPPRWPGTDRLSPFPGRGSLLRESKKDRAGTSADESTFLTKEDNAEEIGRGEKAKKKSSIDQKKRKTRAVNPSVLLKNRNDLKRGIILKEVLGTPKSKEMMLHSQSLANDPTNFERKSNDM